MLSHSVICVCDGVSSFSYLSCHFLFVDLSSRDDVSFSSFFSVERKVKDRKGGGCIVFCVHPHSDYRMTYPFCFCRVRILVRTFFIPFQSFHTCSFFLLLIKQTKSNKIINLNGICVDMYEYAFTRFTVSTISSTRSRSCGDGACSSGDASPVSLPCIKQDDNT